MISRLDSGSASVTVPRSLADPGGDRFACGEPSGWEHWNGTGVKGGGGERGGPPALVRNARARELRGAPRGGGRRRLRLALGLPLGLPRGGRAPLARARAAPARRRGGRRARRARPALRVAPRLEGPDLARSALRRAARLRDALRRLRRRRVPRSRGRARLRARFGDRALRDAG